MSTAKLKILFRTAGGRAPKKELGLGHVYRCLNLAHYLKTNELHFLIEDYGGVKKILNKKKIDRISYLKNEIPYRDDIKKTLSYIEKNRIDVIIIDKYKVAEKYVRDVRKYVKTVLISDLKIINYPADLIVNGFIGYKNHIQKNKFRSKCLLGPTYQILNKEFTKKKKKYKKKYDLLITVGGFDEKNILEFLLELLTKFSQRLKVKIILGPSTVKSQKMKMLIKKYGKFIDLVGKTENMHDEIKKVEFGICSGGITTYEFASMKIPFAIVCQVKHQLITAGEWHQRNVALNLGLFSKDMEKKIIKLFQKLEHHESIYKKTNKTIVDGKGAKRVVHEILRMSN